MVRVNYRQDAAKRQTADIKFTHRPKINSMHRFTSNLAGPTGMWVRLAVQNFTQNRHRVWECGPKYKKSTFLVKSRPAGASPLTDFEFFKGFLYA